MGYDIRYKRYIRADARWEDNPPLTTDPAGGWGPFALEDQAGDIWVFWSSTPSAQTDIRYKRYIRADARWEDNPPLTTATQVVSYLSALEDQAGDIWVFWSSNFDIWCKRYSRGKWSDDTQLTKYSRSDDAPFALADRTGALWVFWQSDRSGTDGIWYTRYSRASDSWEKDTLLTTDPVVSGVQPFALADRAGALWVFWNSETSAIDVRDFRYRKIFPSL